MKNRAIYIGPSIEDKLFRNSIVFNHHILLYGMTGEAHIDDYDEELLFKPDGSFMYWTVLENDLYFPRN